MRLAGTTSATPNSLNAHSKMSANAGALVRILGRLKNGDWVLDDVVEVFRQALLTRIASRGLDTHGKLPLAALTALAYQRTTLLPAELSNDGDFIPAIAATRTVSSGSADWDRFWCSAVQHVRADAIFAPGQACDEREVSAALDVIQRIAPDTALELKRRIDFICLFRAANFRSASHPHYFGTIFLQLGRAPEDVALSIIHELAHQELFLLNMLDRLVNASFDFNLVHAPYQDKDRPPIGRLHSAHALFRMIQFERGTDSPTFQRHRRLLSDTVSSFTPGELTPFSKELVNEIYQEAAC